MSIDPCRLPTYGRPQQLDGEGPVGEAEARLLFVADVPVGQYERDCGRQTERNALQDVDNIHP